MLANMSFKYSSFTKGHIVSLLRARLENGCGSLRSCFSPVQRGNHGTAFLGKSVFLLAAARLIGSCHFRQSGNERRLQVCLDKVVPMAQVQFFLKFGSAQCSITNSQQSLDLPGDLPGDSTSQFP